MSEADIFAGFELRTLPDGTQVAVFRAANNGTPVCGDESVFDAASLEVRIRNLWRAGLDSGLSEAALAALRGAATQEAAKTTTDQYYHPVACMPGRAELLQALESAVIGVGERHMHAPCLALLVVRDFAHVALGHGKDAELAVLLGVADRLSENLRRVDTLVHLGGACFGACLPRVPRSDAISIIDRLRRAVAAAPIEIPGGVLEVRLETEVHQADQLSFGAPAKRALALLALAEANCSTVTKSLTTGEELSPSGMRTADSDL